MALADTVRLLAVASYQQQPLYQINLIVQQSDTVSRSILDLKGKVFAYAGPAFEYRLCGTAPRPCGTKADGRQHLFSGKPFSPGRTARRSGPWRTVWRMARQSIVMSGTVSRKSIRNSLRRRGSSRQIRAFRLSADCCRSQCFKGRFRRISKRPVSHERRSRRARAPRKTQPRRLNAARRRHDGVMKMMKALGEL